MEADYLKYALIKFFTLLVIMQSLVGMSIGYADELRNTTSSVDLPTCKASFPEFEYIIKLKNKLEVGLSGQKYFPLAHPMYEVIWHENKRIKAIVELNQSEEWNGSMHSWYKNGAYLGCAGLENGQHIGISIAYHRNGNLRAVANFDNGLPVGLEYQFDQLGELRSTKEHGLVSLDGKTKKFDH